MIKWKHFDDEIEEMIDAVKTQEDADAIYLLLDLEMCDERIFQDGEVGEKEASQTFNYWLKKAKRIRFKPSKNIEADVFFGGVIPKSYGVS